MKGSGFFRIRNNLLYQLEKDLRFFDFNNVPNVIRIDSIENFNGHNLLLSDNEIAPLLCKGASLFVYFENQQPLGMMCGYRGPCYIRGPGISLLHGENMVYWFWIYVLPEARGRKVFTQLKFAFFSHYIHAAGFSALVDPKNTVMRKEMLKLGFDANKRFFSIKFFNIVFNYETDMKTGQVKQRLGLGNKYNLLVI